MSPESELRAHLIAVSKLLEDSIRMVQLERDRRRQYQEQRQQLRVIVEKWVGAAEAARLGFWPSSPLAHTEQEEITQRERFHANYVSILQNHVKIKMAVLDHQMAFLDRMLERHEDTSRVDTNGRAISMLQRRNTLAAVEPSAMAAMSVAQRARSSSNATTNSQSDSSYRSYSANMYPVGGGGHGWCR